MDTAIPISTILARRLACLRPANFDTELPLLLEHYADDVVFRDPIQTLNGKRAFERMNRHLAERSKDFRFDLLDETGAGDVVFLRWCMHLTPTFGPTMAVEGVSYLRINQARLVVEHVDYWDLPSFFASAVPSGERVLRALLKPLA